MMLPDRIDGVFAGAARDMPDHVHLVLTDGREISYGETYARAASLAGAFLSAGIVKGDRVACFMRNSREIVEFFIACGIANVIGVAINTMSMAREVERIFDDCGPTGIVAENQFLEQVPNGPALAAMHLRVATHMPSPPDGWENYDMLVGHSDPAPQPVGATRDDPAMMIYSSGTTGAAKGILLSHGALVADARMTLQVLQMTSQDRFMTVLPMFSSFGFAFDFLQVGLLRASVVILEQFEERLAVELIERSGVTFLAAVPTMLARMFDGANIDGLNISSLRLIDVGGGPVSPRLKLMLSEDYGAQVVESYGLTEISPVASVQVPGRDNPLGSCGPVLPGIECRVVGFDGTPAKQGEPGELQFASPTVMIGYWNQPELTAEMLKDGWLRTGDVGRIDEHGHIHILDRTKDMIVSNGFNVYPKEVENVIAEIPGVQSVAVVGSPDEIAGEIICVFIVLKPDEKLTGEKVLRHCAKTLSNYKRPKEVRFIDTMPLTGSGKIRRVHLRTMLGKDKDNIV